MMSLLATVYQSQTTSYKIGYAIGAFVGKFWLLLLVVIVIGVIFFIRKKRKKAQ